MEAERAELCEIGRRAWERGLLDGTGGNLSCRIAGGHVLCTPTLTAKGQLTPADLCVMDLDGNQVQGTRKCSSEALMHLEVYAARPEVQAVIHCHPPYATTLAALGEELPTGVLPEGDILLGQVPLVPYQTPGTRALGVALREHMGQASGALLENHGSVTWAGTLGVAYNLSETLEAVCRVVFQARQIGKLNRIAGEERAKLAAVRRQLLADGML